MNALVRLHRRPAYTPFPNHLDELVAGLFHNAAPEGRVARSIKLDVSEDDKAYRVAASLPGVKKEDIQVSVEKNEVSIRAEVKRETVEGERVLHSERYFGKTERVFTLEQEIDEAGVQAKYADGVLTLELPKKAPAAAKRVSIQ